jgi:hypothetical protein
VTRTVPLFAPLLFVGAVLSVAGCRTDPVRPHARIGETVAMPTPAPLPPTHAGQLVADPAGYQMDIQAAGLATIPTASLAADGSLTLSYRYESEGEKRQGSMTLASRADHRYEGQWKTNAHTGNVYQGTLHFTFAADGTATGSYRFEGRDYAITIRKRR